MLMRALQLAGSGKAGRIQIRAGDGFTDNQTWFGNTGPLDNQRDADAAFVIVPLFPRSGALLVAL